tara:strand:- start:1215 stop:2549 length:1335 start_codon:yes stop_codon:yes gene_type:complete
MIALYPGAFKPPHKGHFEVVKSLLNGSFFGTTYELSDFSEKGEDLLKGKGSKVEDIDKVIIFIGAGERNGIDVEKSLAIWKIYQKLLPGEIEIYYKAPNPMMNAKKYAETYPDQTFYAVTGIRSENDIPDLKRVSTFKKVPNVKGLAMTSPKNMETIRATDLRQAILDDDLNNIADFFPSELSRKQVTDIVRLIKSGIVAEEMVKDIDEVFSGWFDSDTVEENSSGMPSRQNTIMRSKDRQKLINLFNHVRNQIGDNNYDISFKQDHIDIRLKEKGLQYGFDYTPYMGSIVEYMIDEGMNILPLPEIKVRKDVAEAEDFFGKTAYYNPNEKEVVLYVMNRHPKDVMRSFTHEMIHHMQNIENRLTPMSTTNTNENETLQEIEKEAYLLGNITFRNWEDRCKNMQEGLWANINAKKASGGKSSHKNSKAYKQAVKAGNKLEKTKK